MSGVDGYAQRGGYVMSGGYDTPSPWHGIQCDTVGKWAVSILLECFLVGNNVLQSFSSRITKSKLVKFIEQIQLRNQQCLVYSYCKVQTTRLLNPPPPYSYRVRLWLVSSAHQQILLNISKESLFCGHSLPWSLSSVLYCASRVSVRHVCDPSRRKLCVKFFPCMWGMGWVIVTVCNSSYGKVMFSQVSACPQWGVHP